MTNKGDKMNDLVDLIIAYETGEANDKQILDLFSKLVKNGQAWSLQGHYGRTAKAMIENELLSVSGELTSKAKDLLEEANNE
jgi:hypothetical protein